MNIIKEPLVYFKNLSAYDSAWNGTDANVRFDSNTKNDAIIFVEDSGKIYTHGHSFGGGSATNLGDEITINNGVISPNNLPTASKNNKGIVQIGDGIEVTTAGLISADIPAIINGINGQAGKDGVPGLNADSFTLTPATSSKLGGVKIGQHINVTSDGTISADVTSIWNTIKGTPGLNGLKGDPGDPGKDGTDGFDPYIGEDGYWYTKTGKTDYKASGYAGGISLQEGHAITIDSIDWNTGTTQYTIGVDESQLNLKDAIKTNVVVTPTYNANSENVEMIATIAIDNEVKGIYAHVGGSGEPAQYIKKATYENRVLTLFPNSGENIVVTVPASSSTSTGGGTYYGGTGITINDENLISAKQATRDERGAVKIWEKDNNVTIDGITLGDSDNRRYAVNLDSNGVAYVQVPWSDTPFDPVNNDYIQNKLNEAELRSNELAGEIEDVADQMNAILDEDFAEKLNRAKDAIDNAQDELDQLHTLLESDVVIKTDPVYTNLAAYLDRGNNAYYSFDEAIDLTLVDKLSDENPEATVYSKVLKIVKDNSVDGETVNGRIDSAVTNVKDEITVDLNGYAKKQFVADTVRTEVDAATESVYDTYSDAGLTISSEGYVKIDASKAKFTNGEAQSLSLAEIITDAEDGILATAGSKDFVAGNLREAGLSIGTDGKFSLLSQFRDLQEDGTSGDLRTLAGIIGGSGGMDAEIGLVAKSKINENKATIIGWVKEDTSGIELTADQIILNAEETIADHINALDITTGNLNTTNANIQSRLTAAEANITNLQAHTINTDQLKTGVADAGYLIIGRTNSDDVTAFTPKGLYFALNREEIYRTLNSDGTTWTALSTDGAYDNLFGHTSLMSNNGFYFYPNGTSGNGAYGIDVKSIGSDDKTNVETWLHMSSKNGTTYMGPNYFISSSKAITGSGDGGLQQWTTNLMSDGASYTYISPNNGVIASKTNNNIEYYSVVSGGKSGRIFVGQASSDNNGSYTENGQYTSIVKGMVSTVNNVPGKLTYTTITPGYITLCEGDKQTELGLSSKLPGTLTVNGYIFADRVYTKTRTQVNDIQEIPQEILDAIGNNGKVVQSGYWETPDYDDEPITIYNCGANGIEIPTREGTSAYLTADVNPNNYYDGTCFNVSANHVKFGASNFDEGDDESIYLENKAIYLHSKAVESDEPLNQLALGIDSTDQYSYITGRDLKITSSSFNHDTMSYGHGSVDLDADLVVNGDVYIDADKSIQFGDNTGPKIYKDGNKLRINNAISNYCGTSGKSSIIWIHPDGDEDPMLQFGIDEQEQNNPDIEIKTYGDYGRLSFNSPNGFYFNGDITYSGSHTLASDSNLKNIGSDITLTAEQVANAPAVNFTWKNDENNINHVGSIAQYWQVVMPEVVSETKNGLGLDYSTTALMSAITVAKELVALKEEIAQLEAKINELTSNN